MERRKKEIVKLLAGMFCNVAVIGFGLAIYESRPLALFAGIFSIALAILLTWRSES